MTRVDYFLDARLKVSTYVWMSAHERRKVVDFYAASFGQQIRHKRALKKIPIWALAQALNVSPLLMAKYERAEVRIPLIHLLILQRYLQLDFGQAGPHYISNLEAAKEDPEEMSFALEETLGLNTALTALAYVHSKKASKKKILNFIHAFRRRKRVSRLHGSAVCNEEKPLAFISRIPQIER